MFHKCLSKRILHTCNSLSQELHIPPGFRGTYKHWTDIGLSKALKDTDKGLSIRKVSDMYGIPRSTLHDHVSGKLHMEQSVDLTPIRILKKRKSLQVF